MAQVLAQVRLTRTTELPEDVVINTFAFGTPTPGAATNAELDDIVAGLEEFYKTPTAGSRTVASYISPLILSTVGKHQIRLYNPSAPLGAPPVRTVALTITTGGNPPLPAEVALCLSFKALPLSTLNPQSSRGRIYLGPFTTEVVTPAASGDARPQGLLQTTLVEAGKRLMDRPATSWSVASRVAGVFSEVVEVWCDNAFDTQRRRGADPTTRVTRLAGSQV